MSQHHPGRHELGQNFLVDRKFQSIVVDSATSAKLPVVELGAGDGALTRPLSRKSTDLTAVEIDPRRVRKLKEDLGRKAKIVRADLLRYRLPPEPHTIVANLPFHITTAALRRLLPAPHWQRAVLLTQWEVARRRAGVGGGSLLTATWAPWFEFELICRVPARAFRPVPSVDGGIFVATRRATPLVEAKPRYQRFVASIFKAPGSTVAEKVARSGRMSRAQVERWSRFSGYPARTRPRDMDAEAWASLWEAHLAIS